MSDYTPTTTFENKDDLTTGDPDKIILGEDLDVEFAAIQVAIATKYDSADLATQAQAEAGSSNAVLMTPLRVTQLLANAGGSGAGIVNDLIALTDPGADRILFWDESDNATEFLAVGTGLSISGNTLSSDDANIDHDALTNFVANEHINHTSVTLTAGVGLSGGGDISANRTFNLDINGLTDIGEAVDAANDQIPVYNASGTAVRKTTPSALVAAAGNGHGRWYRNTTQALSAATEATVVYNTEVYDALTLGTFSTVTGQYTAGSNGARILVCAQIATTLGVATDGQLFVQGNSSTMGADTQVVEGGVGALTLRLSVACIVELSASQVMRVRALTDGAETIQAGQANTNVSIVELGTP